MSRFMGFVLAACLLATATPTRVPATSPDWPKSLTMGTASPGGLFYIFGDELAPILTEKLGIAVNHLPTQGPVHNVKLLDSGGAQLGIITMGVALQGWNGTGLFHHRKSYFCARASRSPGRFGLPTGQSSLREPAAPCESSSGSKRDPPAERG